MVIREILLILKNLIKLNCQGKKEQRQSQINAMIETSG